MVKQKSDKVIIEKTLTEHYNVLQISILICHFYYNQGMICVA